MPVAQHVDQVESAHSGHMLVDHKTAAVREIPGAKQFSAACVAPNRETSISSENFNESNREIIVKDDHHDPRADNSLCVLIAFACAHIRLQKTGVRRAALIWLNLGGERVD